LNLTVYLPDDLAQEVRDADLPVSTICQKALREALHGTTDPLERIATDLARIREALGIEAADPTAVEHDEVDVATSILLEAAARREILKYREFSERLRDRGVTVHWRSPRMGALLDQVNQRRLARGYGLLSALVVGSANGLPGEGFFVLAARHERVGDRRTLWRRELNRVFEEATTPPPQ
jgi:post-segregation antitoxin (ccd killing protein)